MTVPVPANFPSTQNKPIKSPYPYFGGKAKVASSVWERFGDVPNYVEPFFGSGAVLLARPHAPRTETINDLDSCVSNFYRAIRDNPDKVAHYADYPINETDLTARHQYIVNQNKFRENMLADPDYYDAKIAGWWIWGISQWIGGGWCARNKYNYKNDPKVTRVHRRRPILSNATGIHAKGVTDIYFLMRRLQLRMRKVRVCCGDWNRVLTKTPTTLHGVTAVFLDPPYTAKAGRAVGCYANDSFSVGHKAAKWAFENGDNPNFRIALCGYEGEYKVPANWETLAWKANGGMSGLGKGKTQGSLNRKKERIWFSPHCLKASLPLFDKKD